MSTVLFYSKNECLQAVKRNGLNLPACGIKDVDICMAAYAQDRNATEL